MSAFIIHEVCKQISNKLRRQLSDIEKLACIERIKAIDPNILKGVPLHDAVNSIAHVVMQNINFSNQAVARDIDVHEFMREFIGTTAESGGVAELSIMKRVAADEKLPNISVNIAEVLGESSIIKLGKELNPDCDLIYNYILLDSFGRDTSFDSSNVLQTYVFNYSPIPKIAEGIVSTNGGIGNIISIRILEAVVPNYFFSEALDIYMEQNKCVGLHIKEFDAQAMIYNTGTGPAKLHWLFTNVTNESSGNQLGNPYVHMLNAGEPEAYQLRFRDPLTQFSTLSLTFTNPNYPIQVPMDRDKATVTVGAVTTFTTAHGYVCIPPTSYTTIPITVVITGFSTTTPDVDYQVINLVNNPDGYQITIINPTTFSIPINTTGLILPPDLVVTCLNAINRVMVGMEFCYKRGPDDIMPF